MPSGLTRMSLAPNDTVSVDSFFAIDLLHLYKDKNCLVSAKTTPRILADPFSRLEGIYSSADAWKAG
jgi:hypothetical protein